MSEPMDVDAEIYDLEYLEDSSSSELDVEIQNVYYRSKELKKSDSNAAMASFKNVLNLEGSEKGEWGFRALKQLIKINYRLNNFEAMMAYYKQLLTYTTAAVTQNHSEKSIRSMLNYVTSNNKEFLQNFYETTLSALQYCKNDRVWFKANLKLGKLWLDKKDYVKLTKVIKQLREAYKKYEAESDGLIPTGIVLLEISALEIQMYTEQQNNQKLKALYAESIRIKTVAPYIHAMGIIRECGGKMHLRSEEFDKAYVDFFAAFKNYDEVGHPRRTNCLQYLVLASLLMMSPINPFDSPEIKPYQNHPDLTVIRKLFSAYQDNDFKTFEKILKPNMQPFMEDAFLQEHIEDFVRNVRIQAIRQLISAYRRIKLSYIATELNIDVEDVERLLVFCILEEIIDGRLDQINQVLIIKPTVPDCTWYHGMDNWRYNVGRIHRAITRKLP